MTAANINISQAPTPFGGGQIFDLYYFFTKTRKISGGQPARPVMPVVL